MTEKFEEKMRLLHQDYGQLTPEERRRLLEGIRRKNILAFRKLERLKHELLRMETKRVQLRLAGNEKELQLLEARILRKKEEFLRGLFKTKRGM
ncbi:hypothetical protein [Enterococcus mediterraneensis]|uniref:hypothetical protein n=1 Tax=Enterococcus mediterraneensis TaxID=2364791 RepID=UPI000F070C9D|nr:hypothetical protein [Enterococcus mediterraneensis]